MSSYLFSKVSRFVCAAALVVSVGSTFLQAIDLPPLPELPTRVRLLVPDPFALAPNSSGAFTLLRIGKTDTELKVDLSIGGTAVNGKDYETLTSPVTIPAGLSAVDILVRPLATAPLTVHDQTVQLQLVTNALYAVETRKPVTVTLVQDLFNHYVPTVTITTPTSGAVLNGPIVTVSADATDAQDGIASVSFFAGDSLIGVASNAPYTIKWTNTVPAKTYALFAKATDGIGQVGLSGIVKVTVTNAQATVVLTEPATGAVVHPGNVNLAATALAAPTGEPITGVGFYANGQLLGTAASPPYQFLWLDVAPGHYELFARAVGASGELGESASVRLVVSNSPPVVTMTSPLAGGVFKVTSPIPLTATATDGDGAVIKVRFYVDNRLVGETTNTPFTFTWKTPTPGDHQVFARATDDRGRSANSPSVKFKVTSVAPSVVLTSPADQSVTILPAKVTLSATVTPGDGAIVKVNFWANRKLVGTATKAPFTLDWAKPVPGVYVIDAHVQDSYGVVSLSNPILITIKPAP